MSDITPDKLKEAGFIKATPEIFEKAGSVNSISVIFYDNNLKYIWSISVFDNRTATKIRQYYGANAQTVTFDELLLLKKALVDCDL